MLDGVECVNKYENQLRAIYVRERLVRRTMYVYAVMAGKAAHPISPPSRMLSANEVDPRERRGENVQKKGFIEDIRT